jgi:hypothetical protein
MEYTDEPEPVADDDYSIRARMLAEEWRAEADALEAFPGLMALGPGSTEFSRALYEAVCVLDGTVAAALNDELDAAFGDE